MYIPSLQQYGGYIMVTKKSDGSTVTCCTCRYSDSPKNARLEVIEALKKMFPEEEYFNYTGYLDEMSTLEPCSATVKQFYGFIQGKCNLNNQLITEPYITNASSEVEAFGLVTLAARERFPNKYFSNVLGNVSAIKSYLK